MKKVILWLLCALCTPKISAEIQSVIITWDASVCFDSCGKGLEKQLRIIPGVADVAIDLINGQANLRWKPDVRFSYRPIEAAMAMIGPAINDIRIRVRGTLQHDNQNNFQIISIGDGTSVQLLGTVLPGPNQYVELNNSGNRQLSASMVAQLLEGEANNQIATVNGPLFQPENSPPLQMVINQVQFSKKQAGDSTEQQ